MSYPLSIIFWSASRSEALAWERIFPRQRLPPSGEAAPQDRLSQALPPGRGLKV